MEAWQSLTDWQKLMEIAVSGSTSLDEIQRRVDALPNPFKDKGCRFTWAVEKAADGWKLKVHAMGQLVR